MSVQIISRMSVLNLVFIVFCGNSFEFSSSRFCVIRNTVLYRVVFGPERMILVPPQHYCVVENSVMRDNNGQVVVDASGQPRLCHADLDIRLAQEPFPLYPGEELHGRISEGSGGRRC